MSKYNNHPFSPGIRLFLKLFAAGGWGLALTLSAVLIYLLPRLQLRVLNPPQDLAAAVRAKQEMLSAVHWADSRPLTIFLGDSHVEMVCWYDRLDGSVALRNAGLSRAKVADVTRLAEALPVQPVERVLLICGTNDVFGNASVDDILADYQVLVQKVRERLRPQEIVVSAVFPVRNDFHGDRAVRFNAEIARLNVGLRTLCEKEDCRFLDLNRALLDREGGGLDFRWTTDGYHLNHAGYRHIMPLVRQALLPLP